MATSECRQAPCLRSGDVLANRFSILWLIFGNLTRPLPKDVHSISFDVKVSCGQLTFQVGRNLVKETWSGGRSWTRVELETTGVRPVLFEWNYWNICAETGGKAAAWIDNIELK